jgi:hypothetical protein
VAEKTPGQVPIARAEFNDRQVRGKGQGARGIFRLATRLWPRASCPITFLNVIVVIGGQGMRKPVIGGRKGLIVFADLIAAKAVEELVDMGLPLVDGFPIAD